MTSNFVFDETLTLVREGQQERRAPFACVSLHFALRFAPTFRASGHAMKAVSVRQLRSNPSAALREAREQPVMVLNRQQPEALLVHLGDDSLLAEPDIRLALATALYKDESLSLGRAAQFSELALAEFIGHVSRLGIPVVRGENTIPEDVATFDKWLGGSAS